MSQVYIGDFQFKNFRMEFKDGKITNYSCDNFLDQEEGKKLIRQQILKNHDTLPMGEFAIGTNTTAYAVAQKYGIMDKFPILIAEKTGPHLRLGIPATAGARILPCTIRTARKLLQGITRFLY